MRSRSIPGPGLPGTAAPDTGESDLSRTAGNGAPQPAPAKTRWLLTGLRRGRKSEDPTSDLKTQINERFGYAPGDTAAATDDDERILGLSDEKDVSDMIASWFRGVDAKDPGQQAFFSKLLKLPTPDGPCLGRAVVLARSLACATNGDPARAAQVLAVWNYPELANYPVGDRSAKADVFAAHCMLAETDIGRQILDTMAPSPWWKTAFQDDASARRRMAVSLSASARLLAEYPPAGEKANRPADLDDACRFAREVLELHDSRAADGTEADEEAAALYERNAIAAQALLGSQSSSSKGPSPAQGSAILYFPSGIKDKSIQSKMDNRFNRILGGQDGKPGFWAQALKGKVMPVNDHTLRTKLILDVIGNVEVQLKERFGASDLAAADKTRIAARRGTLMFIKDHMSKKRGLREPVKIDGFFAKREIKAKAATLLPTDEEDLKCDLQWKAALGEHGEFDIHALKAWIEEEKLELGASGLGEQLTRLNDFDQRSASRTQVLRDCITQLGPGDAFSITSTGTRGPDLAAWLHFSASMLTAMPFGPSTTLTMNHARLKGRGAEIAFSGDEGPDGAHVDIQVCTFDKKVRRTVIGGIFKVNLTAVPFAWLSGKHTWGSETESREGVVLRATGKTFEEANKLMVELVDGLADSASDTAGKTLVERIAAKACFDERISIHHLTRDSDTRIRARQGSVLAGVRVPFYPTNRWIGVSRQRGTSNTRRRFEQQGAATTIGTSVSESRNRGITALVQNVPAYDIGMTQTPVTSVDTEANLSAYYQRLRMRSLSGPSNNATLNVPLPGVKGSVYREDIMDAASYKKLIAGKSASSSLVSAPSAAVSPPAEAKEVLVRRYLTPKAELEVKNILALWSTVEAGGFLGDEQGNLAARLDAALDEIYLTESSWGRTTVSGQRIENHSQARSVPPSPFVYSTNATHVLATTTAVPMPAAEPRVSLTKGNSDT